MTLTAWLWQQLQHNQFLAAALVAAPVTMLTYTARAVPMRIWRFAKARMTISVTFNSDLPDYLGVQEFVAEKVTSSRFTRSFVYASETRWNHVSGENETVHRGLTPGYGPHLGWWKGRPVFVHRDQQPNTASEKFKEQLALTFITRSRAPVEQFADEIREHTSRTANRDRVALFINSDGWWRCASHLPKRPLATVFTPRAESARLLQHIRAFEGREGWYRQRGLPWHTGVLLTGTPGTGKTSLVHAAASELGRALYYLNLGSIENDRQLSELVAAQRDWRRALLVIEDADAGGVRMSRDASPPVARGGRVKPEKAGEAVTLSALLNVLDGLLTPDGLVVVASSNHPEKIDAALLRPGRFDLHLELGDLDWPAFVAMAQLFGEDVSLDDPRRAAFEPCPGATLRAALLNGGADAVLGPLLAEAAAA